MSDICLGTFLGFLDLKYVYVHMYCIQALLENHDSQYCALVHLIACNYADCIYELIPFLYFINLFVWLLVCFLVYSSTQ